MTEFQDLRGAVAAVQERGPDAVVRIGSARRLGSRSAGAPGGARGPADQAGLRRGDLLLRLGDMEMGSGRELRSALDRLVPGATVPVQLLRGAEEMLLEVVVATSPPGYQHHRRGPGRGRPHSRG